MIKEYPFKVKITQCIYFSKTSPGFTILSNKDKPASNFHSCKEYILDYVNFFLTDYICSYISYTPPVKWEFSSLDLMVTGFDESSALKTLSLLNYFEELYNFPKTELFSHEKNWVFSGSLDWAISPPMLSLYLLLIRNGPCKYSEPKHFLTKVEDLRDWSYFESISETLKKIKNIGPKKIFGENIKTNWPKNNQHIHQWGILAFSSCEILKSCTRSDEPIIMNWYENMNGVK